jgi:hypothetical protein
VSRSPRDRVKSTGWVPHPSNSIFPHYRQDQEMAVLSASGAAMRSYRRQRGPGDPIRAMSGSSSNGRARTRAVRRGRHLLGCTRPCGTVDRVTAPAFENPTLRRAEPEVRIHLPPAASRTNDDQTAAVLHQHMPRSSARPSRTGIIRSRTPRRASRKSGRKLSPRGGAGLSRPLHAPRRHLKHPGGGRGCWPHSSLPMISV